jgi:hypothetical protein
MEHTTLNNLLPKLYIQSLGEAAEQSYYCAQPEHYCAQQTPPLNLVHNKLLPDHGHEWIEIESQMKILAPLETLGPDTQTNKSN